MRSRSMGDGANMLDRPVLMQAVEHGGTEGVSCADGTDDVIGIDGS